MGLFGFVKRAVGKVAKFGLGQLTGGASDIAFKALEQRGKRKKTLAGGLKLKTNQQEALENKLFEGSSQQPRLSRTTPKWSMEESPYWQERDSSPEEEEAEEYYRPPPRRRKKPVRRRVARRRAPAYY
jgi:hypothetical protein